jgi:uncharacterized protein YbaP (TraB family)
MMFARLLAALAILLAPPALAAEPTGTAASAPTAPAAPAVAAPLPDANPALFVVRDADTTIYLFGTFHLLDGRPWFNDEVRTAFDASQELVMEALIPDDPASLQPMILHYAIDPQRRLSQRLSAADNRALARALAPLHVPVAAFDRFKPWFVGMTLQVTAAQRLGIGSDQGPETILTRAAHARHMPIGELEGMEWQIRLFDSLPDREQLAFLHETLRDLDKAPQQLAPLLAAWAAGDVARLQRLLAAEDSGSSALHRLLFTTRNVTWANWIRDRLQRPGTVFVAVGAGHLVGRDSVLADLRRMGIRPTRVPHAAAR